MHSSDRPKRRQDITIAETSIKIVNSNKRNMANNNDTTQIIPNVAAAAVRKMETKAEKVEKITVDLSNLLTVHLSAVESTNTQ